MEMLGGTGTSRGAFGHPPQQLCCQPAHIWHDLAQQSAHMQRHG